MHVRFAHLKRFTGVVAASLCLLASSVAAAQSDHGWYLSGKGGPTYSSVSGINTGNATPVNDKNASNVIGSFGMAAGYQWMYRYGLPIRTEFEFMNRTEVTYDASPVLLSTPSGALASTAQNITGMAKVYWHFPVNSDRWWPFLSGGVGWSRNTVKSQFTPTGGAPLRVTRVTNGLAWTAGIGMTFKLGPRVMNDLEFRWVDLGKAKWDVPAGAGLRTSGVNGFTAAEISFSLRYMF